LVAAVLGFTVIRLLWIDTILTIDEAIPGYIAMQWLHGFPPYENSLDNKGPLCYGIYLLSIKLFGNTIMPVRLFSDSLFALSLLAVFRIGQMWFGARAAVLALLLYGFAANVPILEGPLAVPDSLSMPFLVLSFYFCVCHMNLSGQDSLKNPFFAGLFLAVALLIHPVRVLGIIPLAYALLYRFVGLRREKRNLPHPSARLASHAAAAGLGIGLPSAAIFLELYREGVLDDLLRVCRGAGPSYLAMNTDVPLGHYFMTVVQGLPIWVAASIGVLILLGRLDYRAGFTFAALVPPLFLICGLPPRYGHKFQAILPMAAIAGGLALDHLTSLYSRRRPRNYVKALLRATALSGLIGIVLLAIIPSVWLQAKHFPNYNIHWRFVDWDWAFFRSSDQQRAVAYYLKEHAQRSDPILLHGAFMDIYWLSGRGAPSVYVSSYRYPGVVIPDDEYNKLVEGVKTGQFAYVGFLDWPPDEVIDAVPSRYSLETTVGDSRYHFLLYSRRTLSDPLVTNCPAPRIEEFGTDQQLPRPRPPYLIDIKESKGVRTCAS